MKVIFLDIDGVMNSEIFYRERYKKIHTRRRRYYYRIRRIVKYVLNGFKHNYISLAGHVTPKSHLTFEYKFKRLHEETCKLKWSWLSELCNANGYKICISSCWKHHFKLEDWNEALIRLGFLDDTFVGITGNRKTLRGDEIKDWLIKNNVTEYAIIDDDSDMLDEQFINFFHSDSYYGLTPNMLYRIKRHFDKSSSYEHLNIQIQND